MIVRLNKYLSECGIASRRKSDELINDGRVSVNGRLVLELGTKINIRSKEKICPVGRLDFNTTGVLILTNDGDFTNFLTHPKNKIEREYQVTLDKELAIDDKLKLIKGIYIDKRKSIFTEISFPKRNNFKVANVITVEGRNHFVKRMFETLGYRVQELKRVRFDNFTVKNLRAGEYRAITKKEIKKYLK